MKSEGILRIVVGVDFTSAGDCALDEAIALAVRFAGEDDELHPVFVVSEREKGELPAIDRALVEARDALRARVVERLEALGRAGEQAVVLHVRVGDAAAALHQVAVDVDADVIVVGSHGRRGLAKMLLGSVAEELVRTARVPVLVARPKQIDDLPRTPAPDPADPRADLHAPRVMSSEVLSFGRRPSHIAGLI